MTLGTIAVVAVVAVVLAAAGSAVAFILAMVAVPVMVVTGAQALGALGGNPTQADQPATDVPWVASLAKPTGPKAAGDYYDPTIETFVQTFNESGFITSPLPAPVNPRTGTVPKTNAEVCAWVGHLGRLDRATNCTRCGALLP
jgi:hypothetical protein